jgi:signal transduction histidine kinase/ligand-binding sensor domain-containing protein
VLARSQILSLVLGVALTLEATAYDSVRQGTSEPTQYRATSWTTEHGLPQNTVACLLQTHEGYLWIGTRYGLARYDGVRLVDFSSELTNTEEDYLDVRGLTEDTGGRVWLHTLSALVCYTEGRFAEVSLQAAPGPGVLQSICASRSGGIWVARRHDLFHLANGQISHRYSLGQEIPHFLSAGDDGINECLEDAKGDLWVRVTAFDSSTWVRIDANTQKVQEVGELVGEALEEVGGLSPDSNGRLWLARPSELLCWENGVLSRHSASNAWGGYKVKQLIQDVRGNLWAATTGPIQLHRFADGQFSSFGREEGILNADDLRRLLPDREGNIWVGAGGGLNRLQPRRLVSLLTGSRSAMDEVFSVAPGRNGQVWLTTTYGLLNFRDGHFTVYTNNQALRQDDPPRVRPAIEHSSGTVYFGLDFADVQTLCGEEFCPVPCVDLAGPERRYANSLAEDAAGTLWIASQRGLVERRGGECRLWSTAHGLSDNRTFGIACAPDGSVWVGTRAGGVSQFKAGSFRTYGIREGLLRQNAWPLRAEPDGSVWVGTPAGLNRIRGTEVRSVTMREGLFDNLAYCLLEDRHGNYWTFGNRGIWRVNKEQLNAVADGLVARVHCVTYGEADGMVSAEGNGDQQPNAAALPNGQLWFPTTRGVVIVDPENLPDNRIPPLVVIEEVRVDEETVYRNGGYPPARGVRRATPGLLRLDPGRARVIEVSYTANTFVDSEKTHFRFKLEGEDQDWREVETRRVAVYTNLRPGQYHFRVEARNHHGYWTESPAEFDFELQPHMYQTWPFYCICALGAAAGLGGLHFRRLSFAGHEHRLKQEHALQEERSRIAKDLHDDLGANLTGIALQIEVASRDQHDAALLREQLRALAASVRGLIGGMREVVWSLNPRCDSVESFWSYACDYAENFLAAAGLRCRFDVPEELPARVLSAEARHHLLLVIKEALNNTAKHAAATEVRVGLRLEQRILTLTLEDNGRGFVPDKTPGAVPDSSDAAEEPDNSPHPPGAGGGLVNMRRRVETLGGSFVLRSEPGTGTHVTARIPLPKQT